MQGSNIAARADETTANAQLKQTERRRSRRAKISLPVRCQPEDSRYEEEVRSTLNASREGLYFTAWAEHYYIEMRVQVTFPYASVDPCNREYIGEVVRIDRLKDGRLGIAVKILLR